MEDKISLKVDVKPGKAGDPFSYVIDVSKDGYKDCDEHLFVSVVLAVLASLILLCVKVGGEIHLQCE